MTSRFILAGTDGFEFLTSILEASSEFALIGLDVQGKVQAVNEGARHMFGREPEELLNRKSWTSFFTKEDRESGKCVRLLDAALNAGNWSGPLTWLRHNGDAFLAQVSVTPRRVRGKPLGFLIFARDLSERHKIEAQLQQAQKMEAVGQLAGGVAHDFNNLLTVILGYSELALRHSSQGDRFRGMIEEVKKAAERAGTLTGQLLAFSRKQVIAPKVLNLNTVVKEITRMLGRLIGEDIVLATCPASDLWSVKADLGQIEQVIMNLAVNARDAMPRGGKLTIETSNVFLDENYIRRHMAGQPGPFVMLAVSDTGCGMNKEIQRHLFEPFFTTKERGKGTGLGLATVYGIVKQAGGYIWVYSEPGRGTTFKVYLPRTEEVESPAPVPPTLAGIPRGQECILVVEDEEPLRGLIRTALEKHGYVVLEAPDPRTALQISEKNRGKIDLLLTDVVLPVMSGPELAQALVTSQQRMKVLYMSGYPGGAIVHHGVLDPGIAFLSKPFTPAVLAQKIREVLGPTAAPTAT